MDKTENENNQTEGENKKMRRWPVGLLAAVVVAGILTATYKWAWWSGKQAGFAVAREALTADTKTGSQQAPTGVPKPTPKAVTDQDPVATYSSPEGDYEIRLWGPLSGYGHGDCLVKLSERGEEIDLKPLLGGETITCDEGMGNFSSDFVKWGRNRKFVLRRFGGVAIVDVRSQTLELYPLGTAHPNLVDADKNMNYWLFGPTSDGGQMTYQLRNRTGGLVKTISYPEQNDGYNTVMYDEVNNGFLFVTEGLDEAATQTAKDNNQPVNNGWFWTRFDWLDLGTLSMKTLLKTDPISLGGRGCYKESLESVPGTVIIKGNSASCILIDSKYLEKDGTLRLPI